MNNSVVIRGKIFESTQECVNSIRAWFDGELILSTWDNQNVNITGIDKLVLQKDPGPGPIQQINRQLLSYKAGLDAATNETVMVTRSDISHYKNLFSYYKTLNNYDLKFKIFDNRVVVSNMMTINPEKSHPDVPTEIDKYYRICDWFQVGNKYDLYKWVNIHDIVEQHKSTSLCTEQIWFGGLIKKNHFSNFDLNNIMNYKFLFFDYLINNFHIIDMKTSGKAINLNWKNQPEDLGCYFMEKEYNNKYINKFGSLT
jgi:hypothetical protein